MPLTYTIQKPKIIADFTKIPQRKRKPKDDKPREVFRTHHHVVVRNPQGQQ